MPTSPIDAVVVGIGNRLKSDDAVGCMLVDRLGDDSGVMLIDAGLAPENYIEPIAGRRPSRVLFVDACTYGASPGEFRVFGFDELQRMAGSTLSTHTLPLAVTAAMLAQRLPGAEIALLGIQPLRVDFGENLSDPVAAALPRAVEFTRGWLVG